MHSEALNRSQRTGRRPRTHDGFTLVELLVVLAILGVLLAILVPVVAKLMQHGYRIGCKNNLREIARACLEYGRAGTYSRGRSSLSNSLPSTHPTETDWGNLATGNAGSMWLLIQHELLSRESFFCPEAEMHRGIGKVGASDTAFTPATLSYSYLSQVNFQTRTSHDPASMILVGDKNPRCIAGVTGVGGAALAVETANSDNHDGEGQYVALMDASVKWLDQPDAHNEDDIYARGPETPGDPDTVDTDEENHGKRKSRDDIFLIP